MWYVLWISLTTFHFANGFGFFGHNVHLKDFFDPYERTSDDDAKLITQPLDHFNENEQVFWNMRYMQNLNFWASNGPIYLFIGGEEEISPVFLHSGLMYDLARETNGAMFATEHRFYGNSVPNNIRSIENLKYLSSRQALADIALLIKTLKSSTTYKNSKVVVVGGSYAGNLAAWMKQLYPELIDAAVASSAPVLAKKDFHEYLDKVKEVYERYGTEYCIQKIEKIFGTFEELFKSAKGIKKLKEVENICESNDLTILENKQTFFSRLINIFKGKCQYGIPTDIKNHCGELGNNRLAENTFLHKNYTPFGSEQNCKNCDFNYIYENFDKNSDYYSWMYQVCTEFGYFQTTATVPNLFSINIPAQYDIEICQKLFGMEYNEQTVDRAVARTNQFYGGLNLNVTNVVFVYGDMDPWSRLGVLQDLNSKAPAIIIPGGSHCKDIVPSSTNDSEELIQARTKIMSLIKNWIVYNETN